MIPFLLVASFLRVLPLNHSGQFCRLKQTPQCFVLTSKFLAAASATVLWKFVTFCYFNFTQLKNNPLQL